MLVDLASGHAVGLHFAGRFLEANFAVPAGVVAGRLDALRRANRPGVSKPPAVAKPPAAKPAATKPSAMPAKPPVATPP